MSWYLSGMSHLFGIKMFVVDMYSMYIWDGYELSHYGIYSGVMVFCRNVGL